MIRRDDTGGRSSSREDCFSPGWSWRIRQRSCSPSCATSTGDDGPLGSVADGGSLSRWHERLLLKAQERLDELDSFLRGRVAFFVAAPSHGYGSFERELALSGASLDTCAPSSPVVDGLLAGHLPSEEQYEAVGTRRCSCTRRWPGWTCRGGARTLLGLAAGGSRLRRAEHLLGLQGPIGFSSCLKIR